MLTTGLRRSLVLTCLLALSTLVPWAEADESPAILAPGDAVTVSAVDAAKWIQGQPLKAWEPGKVYVFECWATWCGPCLRIIPHVNELYGKYESKGLRVVGMNIWEDGEEKVAGFVEQRGEGMAYPVAYVGRGGAFEQQWVKPAGVRGIPHAFVVKDGKLLFTLHPARLDEAMIEGLLAGGEAQEKIVTEFQQAALNRAKLAQARHDFAKAVEANDADAMAAAIAAIEAIDPKARGLQQMRLDRVIAMKDWPAAMEMLEALGTGRAATGALMNLAYRATTAAPATAVQQGAPAEAFPEDFRKAIAAASEKAMAGARGANPTAHVVLAKLHFDLGDKAAALTAANRAADNPGRLPAEPFAAFARSVEAGQPQSYETLQAALREAMEQREREKAGGAKQ